MTAILHSITDTRSSLVKLSRMELQYLARYENRDDIVPGMPADLMKRRFMDNPPSRMPNPMRAQLGSQQRLVVPPYEQWVKIAFGEIAAPAEVEEKDPMDILEAQWQAQRAQETDFDALPFWELKKECAARNIAFKRTDGKQTLIEKLNGQNPA